MKIFDIKPLFLLCLSLLLFSGCKTEQNVIKQNQSLKYFESCYIFGKLPQSTTIYHINAAADIFISETEKKEIKVYKKKINDDFICIFTSDRIPSTYMFTKTAVPEVEYILNAYMQGKPDSVTQIYANNEINIEKNNVDFSKWIKTSITDGDKLVFTAKPIELIAFANFLKTLSVKSSFYMETSGILSLSIPLTYTSFDPKIVSAFKTITFHEHFAYPGDFYISSFYNGSPKEVSIKSDSWKKETTDKNKTISSIHFPYSVLNSHYDEISMVAFFNSLKYSSKSNIHSIPFIDTYTKCGGFTADVGLFSVDINFGNRCAPNPENILLWFLTSGSQSAELDNRAYANILSLKIAKKLYTGTDSFLGGSNIGIVNSVPTGNNITKYLFKKTSDNPYREVDYPFYSYTGNLFDEFTKIVTLDNVKPFRAFYGQTEKSSSAIAAIVYRGTDYASIKEEIKEEILIKGYKIIYEYASPVFDDGWSTIVINFDIKNEKDFILFFENLKIKLNTRLSLGVYRVPQKEY